MEHRENPKLDRAGESHPFAKQRERMGNPPEKDCLLPFCSASRRQGPCLAAAWVI